ncbi:MAG: mechanosensitive ion channel protein [Deltaproteobacteria bacterium HGW-Deltaproteobacteria-19]|jgi:small-conductance mechanosensitive channel|nr:MAG: mechanosensitive ion channel protein [Deltaproteobacteria bacterium HGW-Deltaproteobacteria-19]
MKKPSRYRSLLFLSVIFLAASVFSFAGEVQAAKAGKKEQKKEAPAPPEKVPVRFEDRDLFFITSRILSLSPKDRAEIISKKIRKVAKDPFIEPSGIATVPQETGVDIVAGDIILMTVTEADARQAGIPVATLALENAGSIRKALTEYRQATSWEAILLGVLYTLLMTAALLALFYALKRFDAWLNGKIPVLRERLGLWRETSRQKIGGLARFLPIEAFLSLLTILAKAVRILLSLFLLYFYFSLVLGFFPWTQAIASTFLSFILKPLSVLWRGFVSAVPDMAVIIIVTILAYYVLKFLKIISRELEQGGFEIEGFYKDWAMPTYKLVRILVIVFYFVIIFPYIPGSDSAAFKGVSIFLGVLFSLGSTSAVSNMVAGIIITYMRPFRLGDRVRIGETEGDVMERTLLVTRIRTIKNVDVTIPNTSVLGSHIINFSLSSEGTDKGLILNTSVTIGYDVPWRKVHELLIDAALDTEYIVPDPKPFVLQTSLNDFHVSYELNAYTRTPSKKVLIYSLLHQSIQDVFDRAGVEILSPGYASLRDGSPSTVKPVPAADETSGSG